MYAELNGSLTEFVWCVINPEDHQLTVMSEIVYLPRSYLVSWLVVEEVVVVWLVTVCLDHSFSGIDRMHCTSNVRQCLYATVGCAWLHS